MTASPVARDRLLTSPIWLPPIPTPANARGHSPVIATTRHAPRASTVTTVPGRIGLLPIVRRGATAAKPARHLAPPTGNLATGSLATRNFLAARRTVVRARILGRIVVGQSRGRSATQ